MADLKQTDDNWNIGGGSDETPLSCGVLSQNAVSKNTAVKNAVVSGSFLYIKVKNISSVYY